MRRTQEEKRAEFMLALTRWMKENPEKAKQTLARAYEAREDVSLSDHEKGGGTAVSPLAATYTRILAACTGAPGIDIEQHAARITEVVELGRRRGIRQYPQRDVDSVPAPERP